MDKALDAAFERYAEEWCKGGHEDGKAAFIASLNASGFAIVPAKDGGFNAGVEAAAVFIENQMLETNVELSAEIRKIKKGPPTE